jgi:hypothetical protein
MTNLEKAAQFDGLADLITDKSIIKISPVGNQSISITLPCGCSQVQHPLAKIPSAKRAEKQAEVYSIAFQYFELCNKHR